MMRSLVISILLVKLIFTPLVAQQYLFPFELEGFDYYVDSVVVEKKYNKTFGFQQLDVVRKKMSFGTKRVYNVMDEYFKESIPYGINKTPLIVAINYLNVEIIDSADVRIALSFFEKKNDGLYFLNTFTSSRHKKKVYERLVSDVIQDCFEQLIISEKKNLNRNILVEDAFYTQDILPIYDVILGHAPKEVGYYPDLSSFRNNRIVENQSVIAIEETAKNELPYYDVYLNDERDLESFAVSDGKHIYYRVGESFYRINYDSEIFFYAHDLRRGLSQDLIISIGMLGVIPGLAIADFGGGLIGLFVGTGIVSMISYFVQNRRKIITERYTIDVLTGGYSK